MQSILVEKPYVPVTPVRNKWWPWFFRTIRIHRWELHRTEGVTSSEVRNVDRIKTLLKTNHSILITPNHGRLADPLAMGDVGIEADCHFYAMASWHLFQNPVKCFALRRIGAFSLLREGVDRQSIDLAIELLASNERPLVIFPEGVTTHIADRLGPMQDGVSMIARMAAKRRAKDNPDAKVMILPIAIRYAYRGDAKRLLDTMLSAIETRFSWRPQRQLPAIERIAKVADGFLALKELQYLGAAQVGDWASRKDRLLEKLLDEHEPHFMGKTQSGSVVPRVKALRIKVMPGLIDKSYQGNELARVRTMLEDTYLAQQIDSYPSDYITEYPSQDRCIEIVQKFEEDLYDVIPPRRPTHAIIEIGNAIEVSTDRERGTAGNPLMDRLKTEIQGMLDRLSRESPLIDDKPFV